MCGRFTLTVSARLLAELFELDEVAELVPRYNIAPTQSVLIVRSSSTGARQPMTARWGLVPSWAKDVSIGARMINARGETVASKPAFRSATRHRRCLVPADGFYEWAKTPAGKQPHHIRFIDRRPFALAGLWERWRPTEGDPVDSCTIITTRPNETVEPLHDRMPVILPPGTFTEWLAPEPLSSTRLDDLLVPHPAEGMEAVRVSTRVNSPANDDEECIRPAGQQELS
jgi:putative SOS response-associated peptidase YedK